jgi:hypothetical protein
MKSPKKKKKYNYSIIKTKFSYFFFFRIIIIFDTLKIGNHFYALDLELMLNIAFMEIYT